MPVDVTPVLIALLMFIVPAALLAAGRIKTALCLALFELSALALYTYRHNAPPTQLLRSAKSGDPKSEFELSRWYRTKRLFGQGAPDLNMSYFWVRRAADHRYPPALYTLGAMYKMGLYVPDSPSSLQVRVGVPQPDLELGQMYIDDALRLGFKPPVPEDWFYNTVYCVPSIPIAGDLRALSGEAPTKPTMRMNSGNETGTP